MPNGTDIGKAYVQIVPSAEGISDSITSLLSPEANKAGSSAGLSFSGAFSSALQGAGIALGATATAVAGVSAAIIEGVSSTAEYADSIDKASQKLGISSTAYQEWDAVLQHSGTSMDAMSNTFKTLAKASQDATDDQAAAFDKLGLSLDEISGMTADELFGSVISGLQNMEEGTERTAIASTLLGRGAMEMGALLNTSAEDTQAMIDKVHELGGVLSEDAIKNGAAFTDSMQDLGTAFEGLKNGAMAELLPSFTTVIDGLTAIFSGDNSGIGKVAGGITQISQKIIESLPVILETASQIVQGLADAIIANLPTLVDTGLSIINELANYLLDNIDLIIEMGGKIIDSLVEGITKFLPVLLQKAITLIPSVCKSILEKLPDILQAGMTLTMELVKGIIAALPDMVAQLPEVINTAVDTLLSMINIIVDCGVQLITALTGPEALPRIIDAIVEVAPVIVTSLIDALITLYPAIVKAGFELLGQLLVNLPDFLLDIISACGQIITSIGTALVEKWPDIKEAGKDLFSQLLADVEGIVTNLGSKVAEIMPKLIDAIKAYFSDMKKLGGEIWDNIIGGFGGNTGSTGTTTRSTNAVVADNAARNSTYLSSVSTSDNSDILNGIYGLMAMYMPNMAENSDVKITIEGNEDNMFSVMQKKSKTWNESTGLPAFS